jgi:aerobic carbon-monoxide dehydrogenase medium subunit
MKPAPFDYLAPRSVDEAVAHLTERGDDAKVLAGGQSLVPMMAFRLATPTALVDLNRVEELEHARVEGTALVCGALARQSEVARLQGLRERCAMVAEGIDLIGHTAIRNRGTVGGSLAHADPAAEWPALLLALDGEVDVAGPSGSSRTIAAGDLFDTYFTTSLAPDEVLTEVRLPLPGAPPGGAVGSAFVEFAQRHGDFAIAGAAVCMSFGAAAHEATVVDARIALIGVRDTAVRARAAEAMLRGGAATDEALAEASHAIDDEIDPVSDVHASAGFRRRLARVVARRALGLARDRAIGAGALGGHG